MKRNYSYISLIIFLSLFTQILTSCSDISENERLTYVPLPPVDSKVLLMDFTGQRCVNCPKASDVIDSMQHVYGDTAIIAVGIHSGPLGFHGKGKVIGLATDEGDALYKKWGIEYQPQGVVNLKGKSDYTAWNNEVREALQKKSTVKFRLYSDYNETERDASISIESKALAPVNGRIQVWAIEDNITALQMMPDGTSNSKYVHQHVYRYAVNGTEGQEINIEEGSVVTYLYHLKVAPEWNADNVSAVVFIYDSTGILQVDKIKIK